MYTISELRRFIAKKERQSDNLVTILTADHGEAFGENGVLGHRDLITPVARVPFGIRGVDNIELGDMSLLDLPEIITHIVSSEPHTVHRDLIPSERVGHIQPPDTNREYWERGVRMVFDGSTAYRWDEFGTSEKISLSGVEETTISDDVEIPDHIKSVFTQDFPKGTETKITDDKRLKDLGYIE